MAMLLGSFVHDVTCEMLSEPPSSLSMQAPFASDSDWFDSWETEEEVVVEGAEQDFAMQMKVWRTGGDQERLMPGRWMAPTEMGMIPRVRRRLVGADG